MCQTSASMSPTGATLATVRGRRLPAVPRPLFNQAGKASGDTELSLAGKTGSMQAIQPKS